MVRSKGLVAAALAVALFAVPAAAFASASKIGSPGLGDRFFPLAGNGGYDVGHYDLRLAYDPTSHRLGGVADITATTTQDLEQFDLDLRGFDVARVMVNGAPANFRRRGQELVVRPATTLHAAEPLHVVVAYAGVPHAVIDPDGSLDGWVTTDDGAVVLSEPQGSPSWFPVNDYLTDKATFTISMTVPNGLEVVGNGLPDAPVRHGATTTHVWRERQPMAPYLTTIAIGKFAITRATTRTGIPIINAVDPRLARDSRAALEHVGDIIDWESSVFGPYPFDSVGATADYAPEVGYALETQTRPTFAFPIDTLSLVHELAHQWFGDSVSLQSWPEMWLNEGFATYAEWLWTAHTGGPSPQQSFVGTYNAIPANDPFWTIAPGPATLPSAVDLFGDQVYLRGAMTLQALRDTVGDDAFFTIVRQWAATHRGGNANTTEFIALAERVSGRPLHPFFQAWLATPSRPPLPAGANRGGGTRGTAPSVRHLRRR